MNNFNNRFILNDAQIEKYLAWRSSLPTVNEASLGCIGGAYTFSFVLTGLGSIVTVNRVDGHSLDLTNYDDF